MLSFGGMTITAAFALVGRLVVIVDDTLGVVTLDDALLNFLPTEVRAIIMRSSPAVGSLLTQEELLWGSLPTR